MELRINRVRINRSRPVQDNAKVKIFFDLCRCAMCTACWISWKNPSGSDDAFAFALHSASGPLVNNFGVAWRITHFRSCMNFIHLEVVKCRSVTVFVVNICMLCDVIHTQLQTNQPQGMYNIDKKSSVHIKHLLRDVKDTPSMLYQSSFLKIKEGVNFFQTLMVHPERIVMRLRTHFGDNDH